MKSYQNVFLSIFNFEKKDLLSSTVQDNEILIV